MINADNVLPVVVQEQQIEKIVARYLKYWAPWRYRVFNVSQPHVRAMAQDLFSEAVSAGCGLCQRVRTDETISKLETALSKADAEVARLRGVLAAISADNAQKADKIDELSSRLDALVQKS